MSRLLRSSLTWLEQRTGISPLLELARKKTVPVHRYSAIYYLGGMTLFLFGIQVITGILLMLYYRPSATEAFESVEFIMTTVPFGWLIRSLHSWSANLMVYFRLRAPGDRLLHEVLSTAPGAHPGSVGCFSCSWPWRSASRATSFPGTSWPSSPPRWAPTSPAASRSSATGHCGFSEGATGSPAGR